MQQQGKGTHGQDRLSYFHDKRIKISCKEMFEVRPFGRQTKKPILFENRPLFPQGERD
jgi:hypothetical protein